MKTKNTNDTAAREAGQKTEILICDAGTSSRLEWEAGTLTEIYSGGCPAAKIIGDTDCGGNLQEVANEILSLWEDGYDGSPMGNGLRVEVTRGDETASVKSEK